jgi:hypothetical protein
MSRSISTQLQEEEFADELLMMKTLLNIDHAVVHHALHGQGYQMYGPLRVLSQVDLNDKPPDMHCRYPALTIYLRMMLSTMVELCHCKIHINW